jgi:hypothetical protein
LEQLRVSAAQFFSSGSFGLVGEDDNIVLDSYRLARWYRQSPEVFLAMPLSEVRIHMMRTVQLAALMRAEASPDGD